MATIERRVRGGVVRFRVKVRLRGHPPADATFDRITDAKRWAAETETAIRAGRWFNQVEARRITLNELLDRYEREHIAASKIESKIQRIERLKFWRGELGHRTLADITPARIIEARAKLIAMPNRSGGTLAPATTNQYLGDLRHVFNIARGTFDLPTDNPVENIAKLREPRGRVRFLSPDERVALLRECKAHSESLYAVVVLALATGARQGEIVGLRWPDVDLKRGGLTFHETKNGERRTVPLVGLARDLLTARAKVRRIGCDLVFPGRTGEPLEVVKTFAKVARRAGLEDFRFHDLRHTAASELAMGGATLAEIAEVLGHKTLAMVKRYSHMAEGHTRAVLERMNARVFGE